MPNRSGNLKQALGVEAGVPADEQGRLLSAELFGPQSEGRNKQKCVGV